MLHIVGLNNKGESKVEFSSQKTPPLLRPYIILEELVNQFAHEIAATNQLKDIVRVEVRIKNEKYLPDGNFAFTLENS